MRSSGSQDLRAESCWILKSLGVLWQQEIYDNRGLSSCFVSRWEGLRMVITCRAVQDLGHRSPHIRLKSSKTKGRV